MTHVEDTLQRFWRFCQQRHLPQAVLEAIPYIGPSIKETIYGGDIEDLVEEIRKETSQHRQEINSKLEVIMKSMLEHPTGILVIGSGNAEHVFSLEGDFRLGQKHMVACHEVIGGSGVNYTMRLINAGFPVFPILSIGRDRLGLGIREKILTSARRAQLPEQVLTFIDSDEFFAPHIRTPLSTVIVENAQRTILLSQIYGSEHFRDYVEHRLAYLDAHPEINIGAVMVGHIYADSPTVNPSHPGECTRYIIRSFSHHSCVFGNLGNSQICTGVDSWEHDLKRLSVFQLNLHEMRRFFSQRNARVSLFDIVQWFRERRITAVITLDKFGAIGTYKDGRDGIILAWPFEIQGFVDSTGAGDAFGAGLISQLYQKADFSFTDFFNAIGEARVWAAYACTTLGGATNCPDRRTLEEFYDKTLAQQPDPVEVQQMRHVDRVLRILDKAF
jgi:sugar/nucleoside kinase (ribokinase family)